MTVSPFDLRGSRRGASVLEKGWILEGNRDIKDIVQLADLSRSLDSLNATLRAISIN